ncbi:formate dehydrogenase subunit delta, partial [Trinickia mobilis]|uniref:formate dehydrogenase subunit delta n=1 Tax=Trinickia mobilis TaxID=2816356 RepID=UPI001A8C037E
LAGVADHIRRFWEPRMRRAILAALDSANREALCPIVREALASHRIELAPARA